MSGFWDIVRIWFARHCLECGARKPKFTSMCDACWRRFGG